MTTPNIEKYVEEFTRYISANCSKGGYPMPNNGRLFQFSHVVEVSQEWLRATLEKVAEEAVVAYQTEYEQKHIASAVELARKEKTEEKWYIGQELNVFGGMYVVVGISTMIYDEDCKGEPELKITDEIQEVAIAEKTSFSPSYQKPSWHNVSNILTYLENKN